MSNTLPEAEKLYFYGTGVFDTGSIFDFDTFADEQHYRSLIVDYLRNNSPHFDWLEGESHQISGSLDNYSPPKVGSFLRVNLTPAIEHKIFSIRINETDSVKCEIDQIWVQFYTFNCVVLHFIFYIPKHVWCDKFALSRIRFFIQRHQHPPNEFGIDLETIFSPVVRQLRSDFTHAVNAINPPLLETPFLDYTMLQQESTTQIGWIHATLVAIMPETFDPNSHHYQDILLDVNPGGIQNYAIQSNLFAYVESGDSLICLPNTLDIRQRTPETVVFDDWINWIAIHHYTWKTAWELDRVLYVILNLVTSHLKHKRTEEYRDVYAVNALINNILLILDTHKPRNMTSAYYSIYFLERMSNSWRTDEIITAASAKMESLRLLISQLDELEESQRAKRLELFLTFLGVFALGSLVLDFFGAMDFAQNVPDVLVALLSLGIPVSFLIFAYLLYYSD